VTAARQGILPGASADVPGASDLPSRSAAFSVVFEPTSTTGVVKGQAPCADKFCVTFTSSDVRVRSFTFTAPSAGTALAIFSGSLVCLYGNTINTGITVVDVVSQIVTNATAIPTVFQPSGLRLAVSWPDNNPNIDSGYVAQFSLASSRAVTITKPGPQTFYFKIARLRMDPNTECYVTKGSAFTVIFEP